MQNENFKKTWKTKLDNLKDMDNNDDEIRKNMIKKNQDDLKRQMEEKQRLREQQIRKDLDEDQKVKAHL